MCLKQHGINLTDSVTEATWIVDLLYSSVFQPKLTLAKCRRNVENFLLACRRVGVNPVSCICYRLYSSKFSTKFNASIKAVKDEKHSRHLLSRDTCFMGQRTNWIPSTLQVGTDRILWRAVEMLQLKKLIRLMFDCCPNEKRAWHGVVRPRKRLRFFGVVSGLRGNTTVDSVSPLQATEILTILVTTKCAASDNSGCYKPILRRIHWARCNSSFVEPK